MNMITQVVPATEHGSELVGNTATVMSKNLSVTENYADEEVRSSYGYLSGYKKPRSITEQIDILRHFFYFPRKGSFCEKLNSCEVPKNAEGWFAIPKWQTLAPTYGQAVQLVFRKIEEARNGKFYDYREGRLGSDMLRQQGLTASMFQRLAEEQKDYDVLVVAAQFGLRHRGRSVRRVREILLDNEFGLGAFAVGIMILTHPDRFADYDDLWINCAGDELAPDVFGGLWGTPSFTLSVDGSELHFKTGDVWSAARYFGSVTGFLPK